MHQQHLHVTEASVAPAYSSPQDVPESVNPISTHTASGDPIIKRGPEAPYLSPSWLKLMILDIHGGDKPLRWPTEWRILSSLNHILRIIGHEAFAHSINLLGHDVPHLITASGNCRGFWIDIRSMVEAGGWNLRMALLDGDTVFLGLEQVQITKGAATRMASGDSIMVSYQVPSAVDLIRRMPKKLHPRVRQLKRVISRPIYAKVKWHGKIINTLDPASWADTTYLGMAIDPSFRSIQAQRNKAKEKAKEYLRISRKILGLKVDRYEDWGRSHPLHPTLSKCIVKYRIMEHQMQLMDCEEQSVPGQEPAGGVKGEPLILDDCRGC